MKIKMVLLGFLLALLACGPLRAGEARFMTYPDVCGEKILFTYDDDLWTVSLRGEAPVRLTSHPGREFAGKFSPDGKWIAFTASYDGVPDVYLIPAEGGAPRRMSYLPGGGQSLGWTPDGKNILFRSVFGRIPVSRDTRLWRVSLDGGLPELIPVDRGVNASFSEDGKRLAFVRRGNETYYWKRYKGGQHSSIWLADPGTGKFAPFTDYVGRNAFPVWIGSSLFFTSDRSADGITNLYAQELNGKTARQVTHYTDFDVMWASGDRQRIVFMQNGYLHLLDAKSGTDKKIPVQIPSDSWRVQPRWIQPADYIHYMDIGNDGRQVALTARGDIFHLRIGEKETAWKNLSESAGSRETYASLSPDGKKIAFFSDRTGEYQLYLQEADGGAATALTDSLQRTVYHLQWSPDGKKILFGNRDFALFFVDVESRRLIKIDESRYLDNDEFTWEISDYSWSPDSRWIAYSFCTENRNNAIYLYDTQEGKKVSLTDNFFDNLNPRWDADGGYLYFLSNRNYQIGMDLFEDNHVVLNPTRLMVVQLRRGETPPFARPAQEGAAAADSKSDAAARFRVDPDGIADRVYQAPVAPGNFFHLVAGRGMAGWSSVELFTEDEYEEFYNVGGRTKWTFHIFSMKEEKAVVLEEKIAEARVSVNGEKLIFRKDKKLYTTPFEQAYQSKKVGKELDTSGLVYRVVPREEWNQILNDTGRWYRDFFYDRNMHGRDWKGMVEKYRTYIPDLRSRDQLNWMLSELVGELCVSHTYISGGDTGPQLDTESPVFTGLLGADLAADAASGLYRFSRILGSTPYFSGIASPLVRPDIELKEGDYLVAINGRKVKLPDNYFRLLQVAKDDTVALTVSSESSGANSRTYRVKPLRSDREARYARWVSDNIDKTLRLSGGKVGYMHITAMGGGGVMEFDKFWRAFRYKDGLIIDVRGNGGGWTEYFLIDKLERRQVAYNVLQGMEPYRYPNTASRAHYVVVSNEDNGSDGEAFVEHFKARKLGTIVGVPSWGGLVGIVNGQKTIDNGTVQQSNNAFYGREGKWLVENHGGDPDILQDNDPASVLSGRDLQLEKAVETALQKIKEQPFVFPPLPAYPKK